MRTLAAIRRVRHTCDRCQSPDRAMPDYAWPDIADCSAARHYKQQIGLRLTAERHLSHLSFDEAEQPQTGHSLPSSEDDPNSSNA